MQFLNVTEHGVVADGKTCCAAALTKLIAENAEETVFFFPKGRYFLGRAVKVRRAINIAVKGDGAVLITHFDACGHPSTYNDAFNFEDCQNLLIEGFICTTDNFVNIAGRVTAVDAENCTYNVKIDDSFPLTGEEHLYGSNTCDEDGSPDYVFDTYDPIEKEICTDKDGNEYEKIIGVIYTLLDGNTIRVERPQGSDLSCLRVGHRILFRCLIYGNTVFGFRGCHFVTLKDIEIERCTSVGARISPRSSDFTFENFNIRTPEGSAALYAGNADGIHILGLCGYLKMKNCTFVGLGDDALNIHSTAGTICTVSDGGKGFTCIGKRGLPMPKRWAEAGDTIVVYDSKTFLEKTRVTLAAYTENGICALTSPCAAIAEGDVVANDAYFAKVHLENCEVRHSRARGFLLQTRNVLVENCRCYGMALPAIIVSPDINYWYEVGPSDDVEIRGCTFEKCAFIHKGANRGMIVVKGSHDDALQDYPAGVHTNLRIVDNTFKNTISSAMFISAADGVQIRGNRFEGCSKGAWRDSDGYDIALHNTDRVTICDNISDRDANRLLYAENCRYVERKG